MINRRLKKPETGLRIRVRQVIEKTLANAGNVEKAMIEAGYSKRTARGSQARLVRSKTWSELMEEYLPEKSLAKKHKQLIEAGTHERRIFGSEMTDAEIKTVIEAVPGCKLLAIENVRGKVKANTDDDETEVEETILRRIAYFKASDNRTQLDALDKSYRLRGNYAAEKHANLTVNFSLADLRKLRESGEI